MFPNLYSTRFRPRRLRPDGAGFWTGHLPFAADLIDQTKPRVLVELGTHYGESYFGFCQAIEERGIHCRAYAVDNWKGDLHTGPYGSAIFEAVSAHNAAHYSSFSTLLRMSFDEALPLFEDQTVDLLHLDGWHTYEAVKHDFETWFPKLSSGGVVLFHDIDVRKDDFGVWKFWEEICGRSPSFAFHQSCGLGVLVNCDGTVDNAFLAELMGAGSDPQWIREYYELCAERLSHGGSAVGDGIYKCQLYSPNTAGYVEERSAVFDVFASQPADLVFDVAVPNGRLRLDPANCPSVIEISEIAVECPSTGKVIWQLDSTRWDEVVCGGTCLRLPDEKRLTIMSFGDDPQLYLPLIEIPADAGMLRLRCCIRVDPGFSSAGQTFERCFAVLAAVDGLRETLANTNAEVTKLRRSWDRVNLELARSNARHQAALEAVRQSLSWKVTAPLRYLGSLLVSNSNKYR